MGCRLVRLLLLTCVCYGFLSVVTAWGLGPSSTATSSSRIRQASTSSITVQRQHSSRPRIPFIPLHPSWNRRIRSTVLDSCSLHDMWEENLDAITTTQQNASSIEDNALEEEPEEQPFTDDASSNSVDDFLSAITSPDHQDSQFNSTIIQSTIPPETRLHQPNTSLWDLPVFHDEIDPLVGSVKSIGVDYGLVRTGVAVTVGYDPKPLAILSDLNNTQVCRAVVDFARAEQVSKIIVGLPLHKNGTVANQTNLTLVFAEELSCVTLSTLGPAVPVELWDERYTSKEAAARAHAQDPGRNLYGSLDADAACIILEHYYSDRGQGHFLVPVLPESVREECLQQYQVLKSQQDAQRQSLLVERGERMQRRKRAIAQRLHQEAEGIAGPSSASKKKKKKKKKRKK